MKLIKLTAFSALALVCFFSLTSCERDQEDRKRLEYSKTAITMTGAQEVPLSNSAALGSMDVLYRKDTRLLVYKITWSGLTGNPTSIGIFGLAPLGFLPATGTATPATQTITTTGLTSVGTVSGTLLVDGIAIKENDVLNGFYYVNIKTAANPNGEIRGQIKFQ